MIQKLIWHRFLKSGYVSIDMGTDKTRAKARLFPVLVLEHLVRIGSRVPDMNKCSGIAYLLTVPALQSPSPPPLSPSSPYSVSSSRLHSSLPHSLWAVGEYDKDKNRKQSSKRKGLFDGVIVEKEGSK